jgi:hypothetical protein
MGGRGNSDTQIAYLTLPWDSRGREVREIVVRASEDILAGVASATAGGSVRNA